MTDILEDLHNFSFEIEFNDININKLDLNKKLAPLYNKLSSYQNNLINIGEYFNSILQKIEDKVREEHQDEKELIQIYTNKLNKYLNTGYVENPILKIKEIIETPLEGEMAKHNKIKTITIRLVKKDNIIDVLFYVKYKLCDNYNKQITKLVNTFVNKYMA